MNNILYLKSSVTGAASQTNELIEALAQHWAVKHPGATHTVRDLADEPLPHLRGQHLVNAPKEALVALQELKAADTVVIGAPMYNFSIPSTLKAWIDHVAKAGETFQYTASGPQGLLKNKRAVLLVSSGGVYSEGAYAQADFVVPYLRMALGFLGITDIVVVRAEGVASQGSTKEAALQQVRSL